jgi:Ca2+-transporting ATPase
MDVLHGVFSTTNLSSKQWLICVAVASSVLWVSELSKLALRVAASRRTAAAI